MRKQVRICLISAGLMVMSGVVVEAGGLNIGGDRGISLDVDTSDGVGARASVAGSRGINADAKLGGSRGLADADASVGGTRGINTGVNVGTHDGLTADIDASVGGSGGLNASVGATLGGSSTGADIDLGIGGNTPGTDPGAPGGGGLTGPQRQAFQNMSRDDRRKLLVRCDSITGASYDAQLVELCRLLRLSAAR
ncbi:hypothetical protein [Rhizobium glycinendophyticum]|uniref:Uncharacterized protein n=1 Tax=Rhizobium glycinendophyticum TaxID=2589807 RepID=A0A504V164_9HYPH|nr:hypothetical protein [Rhizobium glycinendophyticum]TPP11142.1 hypothetical protein FJQ55_10070 [Rhizobium glycinendophyticum]